MVVIGGGFTAIDCTRTIIRQGAAEPASLVYRRDMKGYAPPSNEVREAIRRRRRAIFEAAPTRVITEGDKVTGVEFQRMHLGEADASGRRRPEPMPGTEFTIDCEQ